MNIKSNTNLVQTFLDSISYTKKEKKDILKYLELKGVHRYSEIMKIYISQTTIKRPTWKALSDLYRYDKRLVFLLSRYYSMLEELLRSRIMANIDDRLLDDDIHHNIEKLFGSNKTFVKKLTDIVKKFECISLYDLLDCCLFSVLVDIIPFLQIDSDIYRLPLLPEITANKKTLVDLRNAVFHSLLLFGRTYGGLSLNESINKFALALPIEFRDGFQNEILKSNENLELTDKFIICIEKTNHSR